ncbi:MAG: hypothetical protein WBB24_10170 [Maribacter sp.]
MNIYESILDFLYKNQGNGFLEISHICPDKKKATRISRELKKDGLIRVSQKKLMGSGTTPPFKSHPKLEITRLGIEKYESENPTTNGENKNDTLEMKDNTIKILEEFMDGKSYTITKDRPEEIRDLLPRLENLGLIKKVGRFKYAADLSNRKHLSKLIELKSWTDFLNWTDGQNTKGQITNDFSGSTIGQVNQSTKEIEVKSSVTQNVGEKTGKKSWIEILAWVIGILAGLVAVYEFVIKQFLE